MMRRQAIDGRNAQVQIDMQTYAMETMSMILIILRFTKANYLMCGMCLTCSENQSSCISCILQYNVMLNEYNTY